VANILIRSSGLAAEIALLGAELQSLTDRDGRNYLHDGASFWPGRAPLLFPIVGALKDNRHTVAGTAFELPKHGFARRSAFELVEAAEDHAQFRLVDSEATRQQYPYRFRLDVSFAASGSKLTTTARVINTDSQPIPVAFGFHPAFRWPLPGVSGRTDHVIDLALAESGPLSRIDADGLLARELPAPIEGRRLQLADALFDDDALIFLNLSSRSLRFGPASGASPSLLVEFPAMPHLGIWTKPGGAPFLCIEPWHGYASPNGFSDALTEKPGSLNLAPGEAQTFQMSVELI
jgi:galactose mutarotase-like enzyme